MIRAALSFCCAQAIHRFEIPVLLSSWLRDRSAVWSDPKMGRAGQYDGAKMADKDKAGDRRENDRRKEQVPFEGEDRRKGDRRSGKDRRSGPRT